MINLIDRLYCRIWNKEVYNVDAHYQLCEFPRMNVIHKFYYGKE